MIEPLYNIMQEMRYTEHVHGKSLHMIFPVFVENSYVISYIIDIYMPTTYA